MDTDETEVLNENNEETKPNKMVNTNITPENQSTSETKQSKTKRKKKKKKKSKTKKPKQELTDTSEKETKETTKTESGNKKGKLVTETFVLCKGGKPKRKFYSMVGTCNKICNSRRELNNHHLTVHPKIMCDICNKVFDIPSSMNRHQYSHKTPKHFCADCNKGFFFESELTSHRRCHLKIPGYSCFAKNCNK